MQLYRFEQEYLIAKTKHPVYIKFLESAAPLTEADRGNLKQAAAVNKEIGKHLGELRRRRKKARH